MSSSAIESARTVGPYRLIGQIGEGGMGVVFLAQAPGDRRVAVKILRPSVIGDANGRARLAREVTSLRRVRSPRIAEVYDADLASYFDTIDHGRLLQQLARRIADRSVLRLIRLWLRCPVVEEDDHGGRRVTHPRQGTPQGGVISPLLANIYLHDFDRAFHGPDGPAQCADARLVRYADDFVVLARSIGPRLLAWLEATLERDLRLTVNRTKTRVVDVKAPKQQLDFLGFTLRYFRSTRWRNYRYLTVEPSARAQARLREKLRHLTRARTKRSLVETVAAVATLLRGWKAYFQYGYPRRIFRRLNYDVQVRFRCFLRNRSHRRSRPFRQGESLYAGLQRYGLRYL